jgi:putative heme-binding domain-containing protein
MTRFALLLLAATGAFGQQTEVRNPHATPADAGAGAKIFRSHCAQCHGSKGEGGLGPNLTAGVFYHGGTDADLYRNVTDGIVGTAMPGSFFDGTQAWQIVAYVRSLSQTATKSAPPGAPQHGETLFREKGCIGCHLVRGEGGFRGPDLSVIGSQRSAEYLREAILDPSAKVSREYWVAKISLHSGVTHSGFILNEDTHVIQLLDFSQGLRSLSRNEFTSFEVDKKSIMPPYSGRLSGQELNDLVSYLWSLQRQRGAE